MLPSLLLGVAVAVNVLSAGRMAEAATYEHPTEGFRLDYPADSFTNAEEVLSVGSPLCLRSYTPPGQMPPPGEAEIVIQVFDVKTDEFERFRLLARDSSDVRVTQ